ncbi:hypothetical protein BaRGS_00015084 [Batillaria attramentaria]|uniref:Uncharacterized protein n=1 Tax=Batillaria attramentaria TaxID=370345 RepID=A0ABD0L3G0_9CAEN
MSTPTQEDHSFGIRNALDTVSFSEAFAWEQPAPIMRPVTSPVNVDCDSQPAEVTTLEQSHSVHHDSPTSSGSTERPNISPARPQRNARNPTGTGHVDKFPRPKPRDRTEFSPEAMEKMTTTTTTAASVPSSEQPSTQPGQKKKNPKRKRLSSSSARDSKENLPPPGADEAATPTVSGDAKRRRVADPLISERPESVRPISESSSSEPSAFRKPAVPAVPTSAVRSSNQSKPRLHSFFVADILSASSSGPDSAASRNLKPSSSGSAVHTTSQSGASVSGTKSSGFRVANIGETSTTTAGSEAPASISSACQSTEEPRPLSLESSSRHPNPFWPVSYTSSITATPYALPASSPFLQPLCLSGYPTPAAACPPFVPLVHRQPSDPYLHLRPSPQLAMPFQSRVLWSLRASAAASTPAPFAATYSSGLFSRFGLADTTYSPVVGSFYTPLLPQAPVHTPTAAVAASRLTLGLGQFHSTLRHADVTSNLLSPAPTKHAHRSPQTSSPQSPVRSAGEPAKDCIDLNDTVFIDVEGDVSDAEKDIDVIDMRDSGLGSIADRSL